MAFEVIDQSLLLASDSELPLIIPIGDHLPLSTAPEGGDILVFAASD